MAETENESKLDFNKPPKTDAHLVALRKSTTDYHALQVTFLPDMIPSLYHLFAKPVYSTIETVNDPVTIISVSTDGFSIHIKEKDELSMRNPKLWHTNHKKSIRRIAVWDGLKPFPQIVTLCADSTMKIFDYDGKCIRNIDSHTEIHNGRTNCIVISENEAYENTLIVTGGVDCIVKIWSLKSGKLRNSCFGHRTAIVSVAFCLGQNEHKSMIASIDSIGEIRLWSRVDGMCLKVLTVGPKVEKSLTK